MTTIAPILGTSPDVLWGIVYGVAGSALFAVALVLTLLVRANPSSEDEYRGEHLP